MVDCLVIKQIDCTTHPQMPQTKPSPPAELDELRTMSCRLGENLTLVQGSGGNTSVKDGDVLWVKASGTWLINAKKQDILVPVDLPSVQKILADGGSDFNSATLFGTLRPSIETSLHCQLPHHIVAHVHSVNAIARNVQTGAKERLAKLLSGSGIEWRYIPYAKPGASLTAAVSKVLTEEPGSPALLVLENHGLVFGGESPAAVEALLTEVESRLQIEPRITKPPKVAQLSTAIDQIDGWRVPAFPDIHRIALDTTSINIATSGVLIPDHAVFLEKKVPVCDSPGDIQSTISKYETEHNEQPHWMIVAGVGVVLSEHIGAAGEDQLRGLAMISLRIPAEAEIKYIDENAADDLRAWDAEKYRKRLDEQLSGSTN